MSAWLALRASLPQLDGSITLPGLNAPLSLERDALGTAVLRGENRPDLARGLGFLHAQERFFEMDLTRRSAAGELSALFGSKALPRDKERRSHRMRARLSERFAQLPAADQALLQAYTDGVNAGLAALSLRPWQYLLLQAQPEAWRAVDSMLVVSEMFWMLQGASIDAGFERAALRERAGDAMFDWLNPRGGPWDAALDGSELPLPALPTPAQLDLRKTQASHWPAPPAMARDEDRMIGSNNWAVAGSRSSNGRAILADDMHLDLGVPSIWYRTQFEIKGQEGQVLRAAGLSLPGMPSLVVGSNGHVAWGFTNAYGQWFDWIKMPAELPAARLRGFAETIAVKGAAAQTLEVQEFDGAPIVRERDGQRYALRWIAHRGDAYNLRLDDMLRASDAPSALQVAQQSGIPHQNILVADAKGQIGWTLAGRLWEQANMDAGYARFQPPTPATHRWLSLPDYPKILNPANGQLWTANNRQLAGAGGQAIGDGGFALGARAQQIRDRLSERASHDQSSLGAIHFDAEARLIKTWATRLRPLLASSPAHAQAAAQLAQWNGRADADQVGYRLIRTVRLRTLDTLWTAWTTPFLGTMQADNKRSFKAGAQFEYSAVQALNEHPAHLLPPGFASWDAMLLAQVDAALKELTSDGKRPLAQATWGEHNASRIQHVMSKAIPALSILLDMPSSPQSGDSHLPRVAHPAFGQSQRLVVSPGHEDEASLSMPGGQSGHPLSPFYGAGHADWSAARPAPLLAGPTTHQLQALARK
ncbi:penicillin acylase family protein [Roseateles oligotrophus]|uniref:penicillin acylase family protein n=1 Tax=Roseateles oligotrophus TaxID=1769250 RepID=UPI0021E39186|nr:penicillin acylase family protein [Roseateles oligotrophus]